MACGAEERARGNTLIRAVAHVRISKALRARLCLMKPKGSPRVSSVTWPCSTTATDASSSCQFLCLFPTYILLRLEFGSSAVIFYPSNRRDQMSL